MPFSNQILLSIKIFLRTSLLHALGIKSPLGIRYERTSDFSQPFILLRLNWGKYLICWDMFSSNVNLLKKTTSTSEYLFSRE